ncbi:hypothetical protein [Mycobacterium avium]|uniref:hypothetical protein n=1 Tax=Mycobacterium avium TaxID=1764 RepID=UPI000B4B1585|nr:hypothetical protein [Mycobacterium avium]QBC86360.1 hypothetical protein B6K05_017725 [Mycobacterium avium subsp. hominissuis]
MSNDDNVIDMHRGRHDDSDPYTPPWYSGPPARTTKGPVITAYTDTRALDFVCLNCGAGEGEFCRHDAEHGGVERKMPCPKRIATAARAAKGHAES